MESIKKVIPQALRNLQKQDTQRSQNQEHKITDEEIWELVQGIGFGRIYLRVNPDRIYPKKEIMAKIEQINKSGCMSSSGALICGPLGTGKTSILSYIAFRLIKERVQPSDQFGYTGYPQWKTSIKIKFIPTGELFDLFFDKDKETINAFRDCPILFLDDFGREYQTDFPLSRFENFIEHRYADLLLTFITTNIAPDDLADNRKWSRIVDRFRDKKWMDIITIKGKSMRG